MKIYYIYPDFIDAFTGEDNPSESLCEKMVQIGRAFMYKSIYDFEYDFNHENISDQGLIFVF